jgi:hypothetical protein
MWCFFKYNDKILKWNREQINKYKQILSMMDNIQTEHLSVDNYKVIVYEIIPIPYKHWNCNSKGQA